MVLGRQVFVLGAYDAQYIDRRLFALSRFKRFCSRLFEPSVSEEGDSGHYAEAKMGQLAQQNGQSDDVKNFGRMLADDHSAANQKALDAAKSMGVTPPEEPNAKQKAPMKRCPR